MKPLVSLGIGYVLALLSFSVGVGIGFLRQAPERTVVHCVRELDGSVRCPRGYERFEQAAEGNAGSGRTVAKHQP